MQNSRQQILAFIRINRMVSAIEISSALHMTPANARHHLGLLEAQGFIEVVGTRPAKERGRPTKLYGLAHDAMEHNIDRLVDALLKHFLADGNPEEQFNKLIPHLVDEPLPTPTLIQRLNQIVQKLNEMNYQARWEAAPSGPRIILGHCPYAGILAENPAICLMDKVLLSNQINQPVEQIAKLERSPKGVPNCIFEVQ